MRLKTLNLKGFKSFPERTRLDFGPGVSVVVGPNGSGKSNVTDAVLWAMGEQSPLAVRGQSMQDVIFGGGRGVQARSSAEVEIVLDNSDGTVELPLSEISIVRRLDRSGEGEYRLNGARCRLVDVIEVLSDTGLGKETHSVISQGRVEAIVTSKPRDRRLLIEEAAGLGKHRKRRRRAQLKLERTQENLDRALDVEREARTRLRPLKRQAEAAELHERLERQMLEVRLELAREAVRARRVELVRAQADAQAARGARAEIEARLQAVVKRRGVAEQALAERAEQHDALAKRAYDARLARERLRMRHEQARAVAAGLLQRVDRIERELQALSGRPAESGEAGEAGAGNGAAGKTGEGSRGRTQTTQAERRWRAQWEEVRQVIVDGVERVLAQPDERERLIVAEEVVVEAERVARSAVEHALEHASAGQHAIESLRRQDEDEARSERLRAQRATETALAPLAERLAAALQNAGEVVDERVGEFDALLARDGVAGDDTAAELRACAGEEAEIQAGLRAQGEAVTSAEVAAQRLRDQFSEAELELRAVVERLEPAPRKGRAPESAEGGEGEQSIPEGGHAVAAAQEEEKEEQRPLGEEEERALRTRLERLQRRREQLGPVNPLAQEEYAEALAHVEEMEERRTDLETALRELRSVIRDTDRQIQATFQATFEAAASNFEELVGDVFPGGSGRLRLVQDELARRPVLGGQPVDGAVAAADGEAAADSEAEAEAEAEAEREELEGEELLGVEIEITPAGKSTKRLSLLSGGEKSMTALAFLFAVFLARPCPFYILDEVEAALDDLNLDRFLALLRRYAGRAQFIVITHQKRTMEAADWLYGVSMGGDGVSKIISRRLPPAEVARGDEVEESAAPEDTVQAPHPTVTRAA